MRSAVSRSIALLAALLFWLGPAQAESQYPTGSRIGLVPPPGMSVSQQFPGFEDTAKNIFIRLVAMPQQAFGEIENTMTNEALKQQGIMVERREPIDIPNAKGILIVARQQANDIKFHKWMMIAPIADLTVLVSFEIRDDAQDAYPEAVIAFSADFHMMPAKTEAYFSSTAFTTKFGNLKNPVFTRNLAVRR